jgi:hypothetical protein
MIDLLPFELQREIYSYEHAEKLKKVLYELEVYFFVKKTFDKIRFSLLLYITVDD